MIVVHSIIDMKVTDYGDGKERLYGLNVYKQGFEDPIIPVHLLLLRVVNFVLAGL